MSIFRKRPQASQNWDPLGFLATASGSHLGCLLLFMAKTLDTSPADAFWGMSHTHFPKKKLNVWLKNNTYLLSTGPRGMVTCWSAWDDSVAWRFLKNIINIISQTGGEQKHAPTHIHSWIHTYKHTYIQI